MTDHGDTRDEYQVWTWEKTEPELRIAAGLWHDWMLHTSRLDSLDEARRIRTKLMTESGYPGDMIKFECVTWRADTIRVVR